MGPLTRLLDSTARNFGGQGAQFNKTLKNLGAFTKTLSDNKDELFGTLSQVEEFTKTLPRTTRPCASSTTRWPAVPTCSPASARSWLRCCRT